jgi:hypothetical protein
MNTNVARKEYLELEMDIYRVIQEEMSIFWEVILSVIMRLFEIDMNMCLILNGYRDRAV